MKLRGVRLGRSSTEEFDRALADARRAPVTYSHVGSTLHEDRWLRRGVRSFRVELAAGEGGFDAGIGALRTWVAQRGLGARIHPPGARVEAGVTLLVIVRLGPVEVVVPNRVVEVVEEPDRFGFAYGTLPGHPERGEESFMVERVAGRSLRLTVRVDAEPAGAGMRLLSPLLARVQRAAIDRYLSALVDHVRRCTS